MPPIRLPQSITRTVSREIHPIVRDGVSAVHRLVTPGGALRALNLGALTPTRNENGSLNFLQNAFLGDNSIVAHYAGNDIEPIRPGRYVLRGRDIPLDDPRLSVSFVDTDGTVVQDVPVNDAVINHALDVLPEKIAAQRERESAQQNLLDWDFIDGAGRTARTVGGTRTASESTRATPSHSIIDPATPEELRSMSPRDLYEYAKVNRNNLTPEDENYIADVLTRADIGEVPTNHISFADNTYYDWVPNEGWKAISRRSKRYNVQRINDLFNGVPRGARFSDSFSSDSFPLLANYVHGRYGTGANQLSIVATGENTTTNRLGRGVLFEDIFNPEKMMNESYMSPKLQEFYNNLLIHNDGGQRTSFIRTTLRNNPDIKNELDELIIRRADEVVAQSRKRWQKVRELNNHIDDISYHQHSPNAEGLLRTGRDPVTFWYPNFYVQKHRLGGSLSTPLKTK